MEEKMKKHNGNTLYIVCIDWVPVVSQEGRQFFSRKNAIQIARFFQFVTGKHVSKKYIGNGKKK